MCVCSVHKQVHPYKHSSQSKARLLTATEEPASVTLSSIPARGLSSRWPFQSIPDSNGIICGISLFQALCNFCKVLIHALMYF